MTDAKVLNCYMLYAQPWGMMWLLILQPALINVRRDAAWYKMRFSPTWDSRTQPATRGGSLIPAKQIKYYKAAGQVSLKKMRWISAASDCRLPANRVVSAAILLSPKSCFVPKDYWYSKFFLFLLNNVCKGLRKLCLFRASEQAYFELLNFCCSCSAHFALLL